MTVFEPPSGGWMRNLRSRLISGMLVLVPFVVTLWILMLLLDVGSSMLSPVIDRAIDGLAKGHPWIAAQRNGAVVKGIVAALSLTLLLAVVYMAGTVTRLVAGRKLFGIGEAVMMRIPLARSIYTAAKQVMHAVSLPEQGAFRAVVTIDFPRRGVKSLAFLTGAVQDETGRKYGKVFVPTSPNPTSGFFQLVPAEEIRQTELTIEEAFKMIISGGIISPAVLETAPWDPAMPNGSRQLRRPADAPKN